MANLHSNFLDKGKQVEQLFATSYLQNIIWATKDQDIHEHWDVAGVCDWLSNDVLKFDVKGLKKFNRHDTNTIQHTTWVEGTNVRGNPGWLKGQADYIVFEREDTWVVVSRNELRLLVQRELNQRNFATGKSVYHVYQREGRLDKLTLVPFKDMITLESTWNLPKD